MLKVFIIFSITIVIGLSEQGLEIKKAKVTIGPYEDFVAYFGETIKITCTAVNGQPEPEYFLWSVNGRDPAEGEIGPTIPIKGSEDQTGFRTVKQTLTWKAPFRTDTVLIECQSYQLICDYNKCKEFTSPKKAVRVSVLRPLPPKPKKSQWEEHSSIQPEPASFVGIIFVTATLLLVVTAVISSFYDIIVPEVVRKWFGWGIKPFLKFFTVVAHIISCFCNIIVGEMTRNILNWFITLIERLATGRSPVREPSPEPPIRRKAQARARAQQVRIRSEKNTEEHQVFRDLTQLLKRQHEQRLQQEREQRQMEQRLQKEFQEQRKLERRLQREFQEQLQQECEHQGDEESVGMSTGEETVTLPKNCPICLESGNGKIIISCSQCGNWFCKPCTDKMLANYVFHCPMCNCLFENFPIQRNKALERVFSRDC